MNLPPVLAEAGPRAAQLFMDGLSVFCFNKATHVWEVAYPRQTNHDLKITIQAIDDKGQPVGDLPDPINVDRRVVSFDITLTAGSPIPNEFTEGGPFSDDFDRDNPQDHPNDIQWMIDIGGDELRHGRVLGLRRPPPRRVTLARIHHSLFCNQVPERDPVIISPRANGPDHPDSFTLGRTNTEIVGVLLASGPGNLRIQSDPRGLLDIVLAYDDDHRYEIKIINDDNAPQPQVPNFVRGDLDLLYDDVIEIEDRRKEKALWAAPTGHGEVAPDGDCHGTRFGGTTLQPLIGG